jgi:hypothetical protein
MDFFATCDALMLFGAEMCHLGSMTGLGNFGEFSSAQRLARAHSYMVEGANHMEMCKPPSKGHPRYGLLLQFIITCGKVSFNDLVTSRFH